MLVFDERGKPEFLGKTSRSRVSNQQTQHPFVAESNLGHIASAEDESCITHCSNPAYSPVLDPPLLSRESWGEKGPGSFLCACSRLTNHIAHYVNMFVSPRNPKTGAKIIPACFREKCRRSKLRRRKSMSNRA